MPFSSFKLVRSVSLSWFASLLVLDHFSSSFVISSTTIKTYSSSHAPVLARSPPAYPRPLNVIMNPDNDGGNDDGPPHYNGSALARDVFSDPYFYVDERIAALSVEFRNSVLGDQTIEDVLHENFLTANGFELLADKIAARSLRIKEYYESANVARDQPFAERALKAKYHCDFQECVITVGSLLDRLFPPMKMVAFLREKNGEVEGLSDRTVDLSLLDPLRLPDDRETFLVPKTLYARDSMRNIFLLFHADVRQGPTFGRRKPDASSSTAIIGSPGVGTSILCFLAALHQAQQFRTVYLRRTEKEDHVSLFVMSPEGRNDDQVRVWWTRDVEKWRLGREGLNILAMDLERLGCFPRDDHYVFVDGPDPRDKANTLHGNYDYFCVSGCFPAYKTSEPDKRLWVLDGWSEEESVDWLASLGHGKEKAVSAFGLCGGRIRDLLLACESGEEVVRGALDAMLARVDPKKVKLTTRTTEPSNDYYGNPDGLRTLFATEESNDWKFRMSAIQSVDSKYVAHRLSRNLDLEAFFNAYHDVTR